MKLLLLSALFALSLAEEEGIICSSWIKRFAADPELGENYYWECPGAGERAVLKKCPEGKIYKPKVHRCRRAPPKLVKRSDGQTVPKDLELLNIEGLVSNQGLGILYNARTEQFLPGSYLWSRPTIDDVKVVEEQAYSNLDVYQENDVNDRANNLNIEASLTLGFLSGMISVSGSAKYLNDRKESSNTARVTMSYKSTTRAETIPLTTPIHGRYVNHCKDAKTEHGPTHVVTSILYGLRAFLRFDKEASSLESVEEIKGELSVAINSIPGFKLEGKAWVDINGKEVKQDNSLKVKYHGDVTVHTPTSYLSAIDAFNEVQAKGPTGNSPIRYQLTPLSYLCSEDTFLMKDIGDNLVNEAIKALVELEQTKLEVMSLINTQVAVDITQVGQVLDVFDEELDRTTNKFKVAVRDQLKALRAGSGNEKDLIAVIQEYQDSAFSYDKAHAFLEQRKRVINTISLIMDEAKKTEAGGKKIITVASEKDANDNSCLMHSDYSYIFKLNLLSEDDIADKFIKTKTLVDESNYWYNDLDKVGAVGGKLKDYLQFALATWPKTTSNPPKHCFLVMLKEADEKNPDNYLDIEYFYADNGHDLDHGSGFVPPPVPPTPVCRSKFQGFDLETEAAENKFVKTHWIEATNENEDEVAKTNSGDATVISISGLNSNTAYNITTKYKVLDGSRVAWEDLGFSPKSEQVTCVTAPTTPVRSLAVSGVTASSFSVTWTQPEKSTSGTTIKYILRVRKQGASDAESMRVELDYSATQHQVSGLDPATLYEILIHTETDKSASQPEKIEQATSPDSIPFPEVNTVSETSVTLIEKISLVDLAKGLSPTRLEVRYVAVNELNGNEVGSAKTKNVPLNGAKDDKKFDVTGLVGGKSYGITIVLVATYDGKELSSARTEKLIITTPFGGSETDKVKNQFDKIKHNTDARISDIDSVLDAQKNKVDSLDSQVSGIIGKLNTAVSNLERVANANITSQEDRLSDVAKRSCIETGINYYTGSVIADPRTDSIFHCLTQCRATSGCMGASWDTKTKKCSMSRQRRGSQPSIDKQSVSINKVCYDTLTGKAAKWKSCIKERTNYYGADISGAQSYGFQTEWDCMGWCLNTAGCKSITFRASDGHCWLKSKSYGDGQRTTNGLTSVSLTCMQS